MAGSPPQKTYSRGNARAAVWGNLDQYGKVQPSVKFTISRRDEDGNWGEKGGIYLNLREMLNFAELIRTVHGQLSTRIDGDPLIVLEAQPPKETAEGTPPF